MAIEMPQATPVPAVQERPKPKLVPAPVAAPPSLLTGWIDRKSLHQGQRYFTLGIAVLCFMLSVTTTILSFEDLWIKVSGAAPWYVAVIGLIAAGILFAGQTFFSEGPWWLYLLFLVPDVGMTYAQIVGPARTVLLALLGVSPNVVWCAIGVSFLIALASAYVPEQVVFGRRTKRGRR